MPNVLNKCSNNMMYWVNIKRDLISNDFYTLEKKEALSCLESVVYNILNELISFDVNSLDKRREYDLIKKVVNTISRIDKSLFNADNNYLSDKLEQISFRMAEIESNDQLKLSYKDCRFAQIVTIVDWLLDEGKEIKWNSPQFKIGDKDFFDKYLGKISKKKEILTVLAQHADGDIDFDYNALNLSRSGFRLFHELVKKISFVNKINEQNYDELKWKFEQLTFALENDKFVLSDKKLSIQQFCLIDKLGGMTRMLQLLCQKNILPNQTVEGVEKINYLIAAKENIIKFFPQLTRYEVGDIGFLHAFRDAKSRGKTELDSMSQLQMLMTGSEHGHPLILVEQHGNIVASHIVSSHHFDSLSLTEWITYDFMRFNIDKLVSDLGKKKLDKVFHNSWRDVVHERYKHVTSKFHQNCNFSDISNPSNRRTLSVFKSHVKKDRFDVNTVQFENKQLFCSEFLGLTLAVCLSKLEKELKNNYVNYLIHVKNYPEAKASEKAKTIRLLNDVFSPNENFEAMHPGHLLRTLMNYADFVPKPLFVQKLIHDSGFAGAGKGQFFCR